MWDLDWNDLSNDERAEIVKKAEFTTCQCCGDPGQTALDVFAATIEVIKARDKKALEFTMSMKG